MGHLENKNTIGVIEANLVVFFNIKNDSFLTPEFKETTTVYTGSDKFFHYPEICAQPACINPVTTTFKINTTTIKDTKCIVYYDTLDNLILRKIVDYENPEHLKIFRHLISHGESKPKVVEQYNSGKDLKQESLQKYTSGKNLEKYTNEKNWNKSYCKMIFKSKKLLKSWKNPTNWRNKQKRYYYNHTS